MKMKRFIIGSLGVALFAAMAVAAGDGMAGGNGVIPVSNRSHGYFAFHVGGHEGEVRGGLHFVEVARTPDGPRVINEIKMEARRFACERHEAWFGGPGVFNDHRAHVEVHVVDVRRPGTNRDHRDFFEVTVVDADGNVLYGALGPVVGGDLGVLCRPPRNAAGGEATPGNAVGK